MTKSEDRNQFHKLITKFIWLKNYCLLTIKLYALHPIKLIKKLESLFICHKYIRKRCKTKDERISQEDMVSVVIPVYDRTTELKESIESILNQTYQNFELLIVCDGSPKETLAVVEQYNNHPKVRIFKYLDNSGNAVRGRNKAIKEARGQYLAFQDSDDIAEPTRLEKSVAYIKKYSADVVYGGWIAKVDGSRKIDIRDGQKIFSSDCDYDMLKEMCVPCQSTVMAQLSALRAVGGLKIKMKYREDHELWLRLAWNGYHFKAIPEILTTLRLHKNNLELQFKDNDQYWKTLALEEHKKKSVLPFKIGYIIAGCEISGGLSVICTHANNLLKRGYDVSFICTGNIKQINWYPNQHVNILSINDIVDNYDILIATYWMTAYTLETLHASKKFYFIQSDERNFYPENSQERKMVDDTYRMDYRWLTMAEWIKNWLDMEFHKKAFVIRNGIDPQLIYRTKPLKPKKNKLRVLVEGSSLIPLKGVRKSFEILKNIDCEVWYVSSMGKPEKDWKYDLFFENVPQDQMGQIYSSCDILLKMSEVESFCLPALEMMACGGVPIVARVNGIEEFLDDGINGYIVEQGDLITPEHIINSLQNNPSLLEQLKKNAMKTATAWNWDYSIDLLEVAINTNQKS